ncbi:MAG: hypothetical protein EOM03_11255 [Clostridia bacterium]|nr:hypothetical protein [Clostridia bacterium]
MKKYTVRVQDATSATVESLPGFSPTHAAEELLDAAAAWIRQAEKDALPQLTEQERVAIIGATNSWYIEPLWTISPGVLAGELHDYLAPGGEGFLLGWTEDAKLRFIERLSKLTPPEVLAVVLWGKRFWESEEKDVLRYIS